MAQPQPTQAELVDVLKRILPELSSKYSFRLAYLFGSAGTPRFTEQSDVDIAVLFSREVGVFDLFSNAELLKLDLRREVGLPIDITILNLASPLLKYEVVREGRCLYSDDVGFQAMFEKVTYEQYFEYGLLQDRYMEVLRRKLGVSN